MLKEAILELYKIIHIGVKYMKTKSKLIDKFSRKYPNVTFLRSSQDPEIKRLFEITSAEASTSMDETGQIFIMINDIDCTKSAVLEEMAHAIQYIQDGNVLFPSPEYYLREVEVKECLVARQTRSNLTQEETDLSRSQIDMYRNLVNDMLKEGY